MRHLKELDVFEGIKLVLRDAEALVADVPRPARAGSSSSDSFRRSATLGRPSGPKVRTIRRWTSTRPSHWMQKVLAAGNIRPRLRTDNYRVEANWIQSPDADIIALPTGRDMSRRLPSNWTTPPPTAKSRR